MMEVKNAYNELELQNMLCDKEFHKLLEKYSNEELKTLFPLIKQIIINNQKEQIYSDYIKSNLYNILQVIRERLNDAQTVEEVNDLISILNTTSTQNTKRLLYNQFYIRFYKFLDKKSFYEVSEDNIFDSESSIYRSMNFDAVVFTSLVCDTPDEFTNKYLSQPLSLPSISYLVYTYPEILKDGCVLYKLVYFLNAMRELAKFLKTIEENHEKIMAYDCIKKQTSYCLKQIKKKV